MGGIKRLHRAKSIRSLGLALIFLLATIFSGSAQENAAFIRLACTMEAEETGLTRPMGLAYSPNSRAFYVVERRGQSPSLATDAVELNAFAGLAGMTRIPAADQDPINMAYDSFADRLLVLQNADNQLLELRDNTDGNLVSTITRRYNIQHLGIQNPQGMSIGPMG